MVVYTYYDDSAGTPTPELIQLWRESWQRNGWSPVVLTPADAMKHRAYTELKQRIAQYPTLNSRAYEDACYLRWLALAVYKRGWMTDYDVINNGFKPRQARYPVEMLDTTFVPCAVGTLLGGPGAIVDMLFKFNPDGLGHVSDMLIFKDRCTKNPFSPPGRDVVEYNCLNWRQAPLIHFSACKAGTNKADLVKNNFPCLLTQTKKP